MGLSSKGVAIVSVRVVAVECILCKSNRFVMNDLLNKLVKPFEHLLESDHKCLFLKLFYSASHLSIAVFNIMPSTRQAYFVLDGKDEDGGPYVVSATQRRHQMLLSGLEVKRLEIFFLEVCDLNPCFTTD